MELIDQEEFEKRLEEDKWFDNPEEMIEYRLPVVQYFLTNKTNAQLLTRRGIIVSNLVTINFKRDIDFPLMNRAFESIKKTIKKYKR